MLVQILMRRDDWLDQYLNKNTITALGYSKMEMDATDYSKASTLTYETIQRHIIKIVARISDLMNSSRTFQSNLG
jgi:hypothetical protein